MSAPVETLSPDGTDAQALPVVMAETRILGLPASVWPRILAPLVIGVAVLGLWEFAVRWNEIPHYVLPGPILVGQTLVADWGTLSGSLWVTLKITFMALAAAVVVGVTLAVLFSQSKWLEMALLPYAVILQVTPIVAIAPLIIIWVKDATLSLVVCATLMAVFPIISNTTQGLRSVSPGLLSYFRLNHASRWQTLVRLRIPSALPYFFGALRISSGLSLIGAVVAEFVAGTGGTNTGLAYQILQAGYQLDIPLMFAALLLISLAGIALFGVMSWVSRRALSAWHESEAVQSH